MEVWVMVDYGDAAVEILTADEFNSIAQHARWALSEDEDHYEDMEDYDALEVLEMYYGDETQFYSRTI